MNTRNQWDREFANLDVLNSRAVDSFLTRVPEELFTDYQRMVTEKKSGNEESKESFMSDLNEHARQLIIDNNLPEGAFAPMVEIDLEIARIAVQEQAYNGRKPVYRLTHRGSQYERQMDALCGALFKNLNSRSVMSEFYHHTDPNTREGAFYYATVKTQLEMIYLLYQEARVKEKANQEDKEESNLTQLILDDLQEGFTHCSDSAPGHAQDALNKLQLKKSPGITGSLAMLRKSIVDKWVHQHIKQRYVGQSFEVHTGIRAQQIAHEQGWNLPGAARVAKVYDVHAAGTINENGKRDLIRYFKSQYTREAIIKHIAASLSEKWKHIFPSDGYYECDPETQGKIEEMFFSDPDYGPSAFYNLENSQETIETKWDKATQAFVEKNVTTYFVRKPDFTAIANNLLAKQISPRDREKINTALILLEREHHQLSGMIGHDNTAKINIIETIITQLKQIRDDSNSSKIERISRVIQDKLIQSPALKDVKDRHWAEKFGLTILNVLLVVTCTWTIKWYTTGSPFFSLAPKTVSSQTYNECENARRILCA